jgi:hypothetical protein
MIDNIVAIKDLLTFESEDDFYHLQILKRKKENPELGSNSYVVKTYYINSIEYLDSKIDEIIHLCNFHNARACINLNRRSYEKIAFHTLKKVTDQIMNKDFKSVRKAYESVCGSFSNEKDKKWIIDIDHKDFDLSEVKRHVFYNNLISNIQSLIFQTGKDDTITTIPTKNGFHLITRPFNLEKCTVKKLRFKKIIPPFCICHNFFVI